MRVNIFYERERERERETHGGGGRGNTRILISSHHVMYSYIHPLCVGVYTVGSTDWLYGRQDSNVPGKVDSLVHQLTSFLLGEDSVQ